MRIRVPWAKRARQLVKLGRREQIGLANGIDQLHGGEGQVGFTREQGFLTSLTPPGSLAHEVYVSATKTTGQSGNSEK
jgi:hypothetical protein